MSQACPLCGALFSAAADFQHHIELMHRCPECGMRLSAEQELHRHLLEVHGKRYALEEPLLLGAKLEDLEAPSTPELGPQDEEERCRWLYPFCLRIVEGSYMEAAWREVPEALQDQARYAERYFTSIAGAMRNGRYRRLKGVKPKACYLAKALTLPKLGPSYANQKLGGVRCIE